MPWEEATRAQASAAIKFQSLFWWKYCPGANAAQMIAKAKTSMFQSLFWWKYCPGELICLFLVYYSACFNPCSGGSIALGGPQARRPSPFSQFQSLFWWKYCPGVHTHLLHWTPDLCFNPCSGGSIALGYIPIFYIGRPISVSILVLVEVLPWVIGRIDLILAYERFQSLFWWKYCPGHRLPSAQIGRGLEVSILVLVEVLPWVLSIPTLSEDSAGVSILVLVEVLPWDQ